MLLKKEVAADRSAPSGSICPVVSSCVARFIIDAALAFAATAAADPAAAPGANALAIAGVATTLKATAKPNLPISIIFTLLSISLVLT